jgi:hypothetical protein
MKVKLVQGWLVVEEDKDDFLNITTPNGHMTKLCYLTAHIPVPPWRDPNDKQLHMSLKVAMDNYDFMNDVKTLIRSSAFGSYIACAPIKRLHPFGSMDGMTLLQKHGYEKCVP